MEKALAIQKKVIETLGTEEVYLVGGSVRDLVMGNTPKDYDFCTPMLPDDIEHKLHLAQRHAYGIGKKFGTIGFKIEVPTTGLAERFGEAFSVKVIPQFEYVEITTFRSEVYMGKSRKPTSVKFVPSLDEDLARRDFTMNAMVLRPEGTIYDPYGGKLDIHVKRIKTVGMPKERINEDPLRMLRAARFAARYGFNIDPNFIGKARHLAARVMDVSRERWVGELDKLLMSEFPQLGINILESMGILKFMLPEISFMLNQHRPLGNEYEKNHYNFDMEKLWAAPIFSSEDDLDKRWKKWLEHVSMPASRKYTEYGYINNEEQRKISHEICVGICARLKFSNDRTAIILE